ncbi:MAG TPA: universal stress protein [Gemmataceae bacterium]|jgi:nucleotide-binding universal stress UspA family protein|nr:universal stress protein [Gemmataceae bacterium]
MKKLRTILHPTDFSSSSAAAFDYACQLAGDCKARLVVVYVMGPIVPIASEGVIISSNIDELRALARKELDAVRPSDPAIRLEHVLREGPAAATILAAVQEFNADLIVMGTHGRTGFRRLVLGSVAEEILRKATCPVLTVKAPSAKAAATKTENDSLVGAGI